MSVVAIGTDLVEIDRVQTALDRHGARFAERVLTPAERTIMAGQNLPWRYLAKRFAAKEAIAKSLGTGIGASLSWQDMEVQNDADGAPVVHLTHRARALAQRRGASRVLLTLSDERAYAVAFAVLLA